MAQRLLQTILQYAKYKIDRKTIKSKCFVLRAITTSDKIEKFNLFQIL